MYFTTRCYTFLHEGTVGLHCVLSTTVHYRCIVLSFHILYNLALISLIAHGTMHLHNAYIHISHTVTQPSLFSTPPCCYCNEHGPTAAEVRRCHFHHRQGWHIVFSKGCNRGTGAIAPKEPMLHQLLDLWRQDGSMHDGKMVIWIIMLMKNSEVVSIRYKDLRQDYKTRKGGSSDALQLQAVRHHASCSGPNASAYQILA